MKPQLECEFVFRGRRVRATREGVEKALQGVRPEEVRADWVTVCGRRYPVRQAFALAFGIARQDVKTKLALRVLRRLAFDVVRGTPTEGRQALDGARGGATAAREHGVRPRFPYMPSMPKTAEMERLAPRAIELRWTEWHRWEDLAKDARQGGVRVPDGTPGVYEAKVEREKELLAIGKAADLRTRIKAGLITGSLRHEAGAKIRANEDLSKVRVRWALTDRPATAEEELHQQHVKRFGRLPKYTERT
jgi:hypothetical protein